MARINSAQLRRWIILPLVALALVGAGAPSPVGERPAAPNEQQLLQAAVIHGIAQDAMAKYGLKAVILRVTIDGQELTTDALGESMTGVPATREMHFRNGAVAISYMSTILLQLVDRGIVGLDDPLSRWMPELPESNRVTLRMLANMTAGYPDYVPDERFVRDYYADPFRQYTPEELIAYSLTQPRLFAPGTNWDYSHSNYVILGRALERITGRPLAVLMQEFIIGPLQLKNTVSSATPAIPAPVLHAFSSERRAHFGIPANTRFYEESTFWNPSWTLAEGAIQTSNIYDLTTSAIAIGTGSLLSPASHQAQVGPNLAGFGAPLTGCRTCRTLTPEFNYGLGVWNIGPWILQNPSFAGYSAIEGYLPSKKMAIAVSATYQEAAFDESGEYKNGNSSVTIFREIAAYLAPDEAPS